MDCTPQWRMSDVRIDLQRVAMRLEDILKDPALSDCLRRGVERACDQTRAADKELAATLLEHRRNENAELHPEDFSTHV